MTVAPRHRCPWCGDDPEYIRYHDEEWGRPVRDGHRLFEKLCLEVMQGGLNWLIVLKRRASMRVAFENFDPEMLAAWDDDRLEHARGLPGVIRHQGKIRSIRDNARVVVDRFPDLKAFSTFIWSHAPSARPETQRPTSAADVPVETPTSRTLAASLRGLGFRHVGPVSVYAFMQSMGLVDDHLTDCWIANTPH